MSESVPLKRQLVPDFDSYKDVCGWVQRGGRDRQEPKLRQWLAVGAVSATTQAAVLEYFELGFEAIIRLL